MKRKLRVAVAGHSPPAEPQDVRYSAPDDEPIKVRSSHTASVFFFFFSLNKRVSCEFDKFRVDTHL